MCTSFDHELELCGQDFVHAHVQLTHVHLASTLDITHMIKCTRLSPTLAGRVWEPRAILNKGSPNLSDVVNDSEDCSGVISSTPVTELFTVFSPREWLFGIWTNVN